MSVENQDGGLARPQELQGTCKEDIHRSSNTVYKREFLLSCAELDYCKQFFTGFDSSVFQPSKIAYTREFLLSCAELDVCKELPTGFDPSIFRPSKTVYTREFLLSCAELDVRKRLPKGFDSSALLELKDDLKGILEPWKGSGILFLPNYGNIRCRARFFGLDSNGSSWESIGRSENLSQRWCRESNSLADFRADFRRHDDQTQSLVKVPECEAENMAKRFQETEKNDSCQLSKSENPYRPPCTDQGGRTKYEKNSHSKETVMEKMDSCIQEETELEGPRISEDEQHEIKNATSLAESISNWPVNCVKPLHHDVNSLEHNFASDSQIIQFDSKKANTNTIIEDLNDEQSRVTLKEDIASSLEVPSGCSSTVIEKALPQPLPVYCGCGKGFSGKTCFPITEGFCSVLKNSSEGTTVPYIIQSHESSGMEFTQLSNRAFYSGQRGSFNRITREVVSELYKIPFRIAHNVASSVLHEHNPIRNSHQGIISTDAVEDIELCDVEKNECTFDVMWSEIMEILQLDQELELAAVAESKQTADFKVKVSLPDEQSLISIDNPASSEHSMSVTFNSNNDFAHYDAMIHLPDEDSLITIDDLIVSDDRLISSYHPTRTELSKFVPADSGSGLADYDAKIHLPDENSLITIDDLIAPFKFVASGQQETESTWMSDVRDEVARPGALVITDPAKESATEGLEFPPSLTASRDHQELHFCHSSLHNPCNSIRPGTQLLPVCHPFNSLEAQTSLKTTFTDPEPIRCHPALRWYFCPNMVQQFPGKTAKPKLKEFRYPIVQNPLSQQPTNFLEQNHLPTRGMTFSNLELEKKQHFPLRHQLTAYPDSAEANSGDIFDDFFSSEIIMLHAPGT